MISNLIVKNFKPFRNIDLSLGRFNLLCGTNSSGKTSIIHAILSLAQNSNKLSDFTFNGRLVQLGLFGDIKNSYYSQSENISFQGVINDDPFNIVVAAADDPNALGLQLKEKKGLENFTFGKHIFYISADRIGSLDVHDLSYNDDEDEFGIKGEFAIDFLCRRKSEPMKSELLCEGKPSNYEQEVEYWLKRIIGSRHKTTIIEGTNKTKVEYNPDGSTDYFRSINTGSGISYAITIIIACLGIINFKNSSIIPTIIIENPEIHLHPKAQSELTNFLIFISRFAQVIVETQSDHVFNKLRVEINKDNNDGNKGYGHNGLLQESRVFFCSYEGNETKVQRVEMTKNGRIKNYIKDLFEQFDIDLDELLRK